jgi:hypothetical protein
MAFTSSGLYFSTFRDILDTTQMAINLDLTTHKVALYTTTKTPNYSSDTVFSATNEVASANYTTEGTALAGTSVTESPAGTLMWDSTTNPSWGPVTFSSEGAIIHATALTKECIVGVTFGSVYTATAGTFTVTWNASGIFTIDLTP